jgi:ABC-2 type transport system ATP-binding protein
MMVRLGFAVAAHIEPENLLVDEVLAVGDTAFQAKCLNKIAELKEQDKTIVLVSHAMPSILQHSSRVLWIDHGTIQAFGDPEETVESYLRTVHSQGTTAVAEDPAMAPDSPIRITDVTVRNSNGEPHGSLAYGEPAYFDIAYTVTSPVEDPVVSLTFQDVRDYPLGGVTSRFDGIRLNGTGGTNKIRLVLAPVIFTRGSYGVTVAIQDQRIQRYLDMRPRAATFMVDGPSVASREVSGHFVFPHRWELGAGED